MRIAARDFVFQFLGRGDLYNKDYYTYVDECAKRSAPVIADFVLSRFAVSQVIDVGCGSGAFLAAFRERNVVGLGLEYSEAGLAACQQKNLNVRPFNIEKDSGEGFGRFDAALCLEVAEHVSGAIAEALTSFLVAIAPLVIFTAATPGQGGVDHVNEQPNEYWIAKFENRGYRYLRDLSEKWREEWAAHGVEWFYAQNVMVFEREPTLHSSPVA